MVCPSPTWQVQGPTRRTTSVILKDMKRNPFPVCHNSSWAEKDDQKKKEKKTKNTLDRHLWKPHKEKRKSGRTCDRLQGRLIRFMARKDDQDAETMSIIVAIPVETVRELS